MHALSGPTRIDRPGYAWIAVVLQLIIALLAVPVGWMLMTQPDGSLMQVPVSYLEHTPFGSYFIPGLLLFAMNGIGQLLAALFIVMRHPLAPWLTGALAVGLIVWIAFQLLTMPWIWLQPAVAAVGLLEGFVALFWLRRLGYFRG